MTSMPMYPPRSRRTTPDNAAPVLYNIVLTVKEGPYEDGKFTLVQTKVSAYAPSS